MQVVRFIALLLLFATLAWTEQVPPGAYACNGRVVRKADGSATVHDGWGCTHFPAKVQDRLHPFVGQFVRVEYTRVPSVMSSVGSAIGGIYAVVVRARTPDDLPVTVHAVPATATFALAAPVQVRIELTNRSSTARRLRLREAHTLLCQDYVPRGALEPGGHRESESPYGLPDAAPILAPGESLRFTVTSEAMVNPGNYQVIFALPVDGMELCCQSEVAKVTVCPPGSKGKERATLRKWLHTTNVSQRVEIARRLLALGDTSGREEVIRLLDCGAYSTPTHCYWQAFEFAWQHGGPNGELAMLAAVKRECHMDRLTGMIEGIYLSPNRLALLDQLLQCRNPETGTDSDARPGPRVCDMTAEWLAGYTDKAIRFPKDGALGERDEVVAQIRTRLKEKPEFFRILRQTTP